MRIRLPWFVDVVLVSDPEEIRWLNAHPDVVRPLDPSASVLHRFLHRRLAVDLRFDGGVLPAFLDQDDDERARRQAELHDNLRARLGVRTKEIEQLGAYVAQEPAHGSHGDNGDDAEETIPRERDVGVFVQQWCGRLFFEEYRATPESYRAGRYIAEWTSAPPWRTWGTSARARLADAKRRVSAAAQNDRHCIHATSIAMENIARSVRSLRNLANRQGTGRRGVSGVDADDAMRQCLFVPPAVLRGCARDVSASFLNKPLERRTLVVFLLGRAYRNTGDLEIAFLDDTWSACPANHVVPDMLKSVWLAAAGAREHSATGWKRFLRPAQRIMPKFAWSIVRRDGDLAGAGSGSEGAATEDRANGHSTNGHDGAHGFGHVGERVGR